MLLSQADTGITSLPEGSDPQKLIMASFESLLARGNIGHASLFRSYST